MSSFWEENDFNGFKKRKNVIRKNPMMQKNYIQEWKMYI